MTPENKSLRGASLPASCGRSPAGRRSSAAFLRALLLAVRAAGDLESSPEYRKREKKEKTFWGGCYFVSCIWALVAQFKIQEYFRGPGKHGVNFVWWWW